MGKLGIKSVTCLVVFFLFAVWFPTVALAGTSVTPGNLRLGDRGPDVTLLQTKLKVAGFYQGEKVSGYFGLNTLFAVSKFEKANRLRVDGIVDAEEWIALQKLTAIPADKLKKMVLGYYTVDYTGDKLSYNSLDKYSSYIDTVATFSFKVNRDGSLTGEVPQDALKLAKERSVETLLLVHNIGQPIDSDAAHYALSVAENRSRLEANIMSKVKANGYNGVNIDIEALPPGDRQYYNIFLKELGDQLHKENLLLTVSIPAKTFDSTNDSWSGAYSYKDIGQLVDQAMIMTYDEHWFGGSPGPIASVPWINKVMDYAVEVMPREKIFLGVAAYGYDWSSQGTRAVRWNQVNDLVKNSGNVIWDNTNSVPCVIYYKNGVRHELWFENNYSLRFKLETVKSYNVSGIAIWRLGFEDDSFWKMVNDEFRQAD
ncbi:glycoside hydrolase family 18 [Desulfofarcimen acetoxidans DSM 771]|uniref:Glycoside hydrolase family 18 n=1 Tax=Desulfofarcimen acetoxidans (strain ATCC 49208 / DSM 771 / KCTC 5769 / VKM B-1644 / 5575) TaxID=485916 RepID=C8W3B4_DESAS|nr:glycosyl hydrolase family 18 protein [Desulfofarcimen acetoxidans]ACV61881.1 glycoside hydrolase family 18 [Desulfofarcimen acetoxidans DSM 771]